MTFFTSRTTRLAFAFAMLVGSATAMTTVAAYSSTHTDAMLGSEWSCWHMVGLTSCTHVHASHGPHDTDASAAWRGV